MSDLDTAIANAAALGGAVDHRLPDSPSATMLEGRAQQLTHDRRASLASVVAAEQRYQAGAVSGTLTWEIVNARSARLAELAAIDALIQALEE